MSDWSVEIGAPGPRGHDEDLADEIIDCLERFGPAVSVGRGRISVRFDVKAVSLAQAIGKGYDTFHGAFPDIRPDHIEVESVEELDARLRQADVPDLLGVHELASTLQVSRQRVGQLQRKPDFPLPYARLSSGPIWKRSTLAQFIAGWHRRSGRPAVVR